MKLFYNAANAFSMYSKIPMPQVEWKRETMRYALAFFPAVGCVIGLLVWIWGTAAFYLNIPAVYISLVMLLIPFLITGNLHLDGLMDTSDALSCWGDKEKRLAVMKDSHVGAGAVSACVIYCITVFALWFGLDERILPAAACIFVFSRCFSAAGICFFPCARDSGLAKTWADAADKKRCGIALVIELILVHALLIRILPLTGLCMCAAAWIWLFIYRRMALQKFGGITGDLQGFFMLIAEAVMLAVAVIVPL